MNLNVKKVKKGNRKNHMRRMASDARPVWGPRRVSLWRGPNGLEPTLSWPVEPESPRCLPDCPGRCIKESRVRDATTAYQVTPKKGANGEEDSATLASGRQQRWKNAVPMCFNDSSRCPYCCSKW